MEERPTTGAAAAAAWHVRHPTVSEHAIGFVLWKNQWSVDSEA